MRLSVGETYLGFLQSIKLGRCSLKGWVNLHILRHFLCQQRLGTHPGDTHALRGIELPARGVAQRRLWDDDRRSVRRVMKGLDVNRGVSGRRSGRHCGSCVFV